MKPLTVVTFLRDMLLQILLFTVLFALWIIQTERNLPEAMSSLLHFCTSHFVTFLLIGFIYSTLFYHLFFKKIISTKQYRKLLLVLLALVAGFIIADTLLVILEFNYFFPLEVWGNHTKDTTLKYVPLLLGNESTGRFLFFTFYALLWSLIKRLKPATAKAYAKEILLQFMIFTVLFATYLFLASKPFSLWIDGMSELIQHWYGALLYLVYSTLFYHLFFKKIITTRQYRQPILILLALAASYVILDALLIIFNDYATSVHYNFMVKNYWSVSAMIQHLIYATMYALIYSFIRSFVWLREQKLESEKELISASLQNLRSQLDPHFIFNSLNNLYGLAIEEKAARTSESIIELSSLFRYTLKESNVETISIHQELDFIEKYIHLQRLRIAESGKVKIETNITWDQKPAAIAPLLLINFIENAFKHGVSSVKESFIHIHIAVANGKLLMKVDNTVHKSDDPTNGSGLANARKRLQLLYEDRYLLEENRSDTINQVKLTINLM